MRIFSRRSLLSFGGSDSSGSETDPLVHIASLLVHATEAGCTAVRSTVSAIPGAELHDVAQQGKLVIVLESADSGAIAGVASELQHLPGVLTVSIVAHLTERASALDETDESTTVPAQ
jgi:nitrate reductase NapD